MFRLTEAEQQPVRVQTPKGTVVRQTIVVGSYQTNTTIIGNLSTKAAICIDPGDEPERILSTAKDLGVEVHTCSLLRDPHLFPYSSTQGPLPRMWIMMTSY